MSTSKNNQKKDSLAEIIINNQKFKLSKLIDLLKEHSSDDSTSIGELALKENIIDKDSLLGYINTQLKIKNTLDKNIESLRNLNDLEKWERLMTFENLGEILLRKKVLKIEQLIEILKEKDNKPNVSLEKLLLENSLVSKKDIYEALEFEIKQKQVVEKACMEMITKKDLYNTQ